MRLACLAILAALAVSAVPDISSHPTAPVGHPALDAVLPGTTMNRRCTTNAECLARGMPLLAPKARARGAPARRAEPSPIPLPMGRFQARVLINNAGNGDFVGYLSQDVDNFYTYTVATPEDAMVVTLDTSQSSTGLDAFPDIQSDMPYLCGVVGFDVDSQAISAGSANHGFITRCNVNTSPNSPPTSGMNALQSDNGQETAVWSVNRSIKEMSMQWTNPDGTQPSTFLVYYVPYLGGGEILYTGDVDAFRDGGNEDSFRVTLHLELV